MSEQEVISGTQYQNYCRPCIYFWYRGTECLYVGASINGFKRIFGYHHVINNLQRVESGDEIRVLWFDNVIELSQEDEYIKTLKPRFNGFQQKPRRKRGVPDDITKLANALKVLITQSQSEAPLVMLQKCGKKSSGKI